MSTPFQNRLVGTIIVAAAAIIFLPDLLNGEKRSQNDTFEAIPPAPSNNNVTVIKQFPTQNLSRLAKDPITEDIALDDKIISDDENNQITNTNTSISSKAVKETEFKVVKNKSDKSDKSINNNSDQNSSKDKTVPVLNTKYAWVIQLGSFREKHNVDRLIKKLQRNGYTAFSRPIKTSHGNLIKVFVGPELSKSLLEKKLLTLKTLTNTQGKIARFNPAG